MNIKRIAIILAVIGLLLLAISITLPMVFPKLFESQLNKKLLIKPDSEMLKKFIDTPVPIYFQIWLFNITNADDVLDGATPVLKQLGPYTFFQDREKVDIKWNDDIGTILFKQKKYYYFNQSLSTGFESDMVTTINPVFMTLASKLSGPSVNNVLRSIAQLWFLRFNIQPFMTRSVKELLFEGYDEPLLLELFKLTNDSSHKRGKFGFFYPRNGTADGEIEVFTGKMGMSNYQHIKTWHEKEILDFWKEERCNLINGTDGAQFSRPISEDRPIYLFTAELCRSLYAVYEKDIQYGPLTLKRFVLPDELLLFSDETKCFCSSDFTCRSGMIDVSPCRKGAPVIISTPHFYQGDSKDQEAVKGLHPRKEEHETYLDIEPNTGVSIRAAKRIQVNMPLKNFADLPSLRSVPEVIMPILWVNESVAVPMENAEKLHVTLTLPLQVITYGSVVLMVLGIILLVIALALVITLYRSNSAKQKKRQEKSDQLVGRNNVYLIDSKLAT